ncbi:MAG: NADH-quinone oxidoreductase subunit NuoK [Bacillota bacterium]|jgi:NADH-quinone oxidoreductase subunit K|uniref:NADH-quinone oxidoreductase subunit K n=1 Tax=Thermanaerosceptrum fracticalcis TaxID=1712410 RepID=A0A7G6E1G6_THEFR|nr:NADH-quinone oxidoreductase subunit NuoK [Thermanaerosceptrum fracticalcis]QNB45920.1 NADH-quinone oxidoreductase subunit NuoK [Thermanaerosceptrum fracticalcis]
MITLQHYLILSAILFCIGLFGALSKKNAVAILLSIELMLNAVNINLVAFTKFLTPGELVGQVFAIFVIVVAAAEVALALAIVIAIYRQRNSVAVEDLDWMKW